MLGAFLILALILVYTLQSLTCKIYTDNYPGDGSVTSAVFCVVSGVIVAIATFVFAGFGFSAQPLTILLGVVNAIVLTGYNVGFVGASARGSYSVLMTSLLAGGILIPTLVGVIGFGDRPGLFKYVALVLVIISAYLVNSRKEEGGTKNSLLFYILCVILFVCNGAYGSILDVQQRLTGVSEKEELIILTYGLMAVGMFIYMLISRKGKTFGDFKQTPKSCLFLLLCSLIVAAAINLLSFLIRYIDDISMLYTFDNAGVLLFSVVFSVVLFKEKLSVKNTVGVLLMTAGLIMAAIF